MAGRAWKQILWSVLSGLMLLHQALNAQPYSHATDSVRFFGSAPEYKGMNIVFEYYSNFIIPGRASLITMPIDDEGNFDFNFPLDETSFLFADLGRTRASIFVEPGKEYKLVFPPFQPRTQLERLNPYFRFEELPLGIANPESRELNRNIVEFDAEFEYILSSYAVRLFTSSDTALARQIEQQLAAKYTYPNPVFQKHKQFSFMRLRQMSQRNIARYLIAELNKHQVEYQLPSYSQLFTSLFRSFVPAGFSDDVRTPLNRALADRLEFDSIANIAMQDTLFTNQELTEQVLIYGLFEAFYSKRIPEATVFAALQSAANKGSTPKVRQTASEVYAKVSKLRPGSMAPDFRLKNQKGRNRDLSDYKGKFVYLNFIHTGSIASLRDLTVLEQYYKTMNKEMEIVTVVMDENIDAIEELLKKNPYKWDFLHFASYPQLIDLYDLQALPAYFLIDPEGRLNMSPAPAPGENFLERFAVHFREYRIDFLRRNPPKEKSIFR